MKVLAVIALLCSGFALSAPPAGMQIGLVDLQNALETVELGKSAKATLEKEVNQKKAQLEKQQLDLKKEAEQFEKKAAILNDTARAAKQAEIQKRFVDFQKQAAETQMDLQKRERELTKPILDQLRSLIEAIGKEKQMALVLEKSSGGVLFAENAVDLTPTVIERFNASHKVGAGKTQKK